MLKDTDRHRIHPFTDKAKVPIPVVRPCALRWDVQQNQASTIYTGHFAAYHPGGYTLCQIPGRVVEWTGMPTDVYLYDPPEELRHHPRGRCLQLLEPGRLWFRLHWEHPASNFEQSRAYVEQLLWDVYQRRSP